MSGTPEPWPYDPVRRAERLGLPDASEETFRAWAQKHEARHRIPQVFLDALDEEKHRDTDKS